MKAFFDCQYGASGDMILGTLLDVGVSVDALRNALQSLNVSGWTIDKKPMNRCGIGGTLAVVDAKEGHHHRGLGDIRKIIQESTLPELVKGYSLRAFEALAEAEAYVHQTDIESVHFHEVGAVDAIVDIVGSMWGLHELGLLGQECYTSTIAVGGGTVRAAHGVIPVPAPATLRLLIGARVKNGPVDKEMVTPTGAAVLRTICGGSERMGISPDNFSVSRIGYGAGSRELVGHTNYLRLMIDDSQQDLPYLVEKRYVLECEIDDMTPELLAAATEELMQSGALDVHLISCMMKKSRPGLRLCVLCDEAHLKALSEKVLRETTSFGLRVRQVDRYSLRRDFRSVSTPYGDVKIKLGFWGDDLLKATPEYEDCKRMALKAGVSVGNVYASVLNNFTP